MGRRGRPRTPTAILEARGSWRARRRADEPGAEAPSLPKACPTWLRGLAKDYWHDLYPQLDQLRILRRTDQAALALYCQTYAKLREAEDELQKRGPIVPVLGTGGRVVGYADRPEVARAIRLTELLLKLGARFGLTPADRANLAADKPTGRTAAERRKLRLVQAG